MYSSISAVGKKFGELYFFLFSFYSFMTWENETSEAVQFSCDRCSHAIDPAPIHQSPRFRYYCRRRRLLLHYSLRHRFSLPAHSSVVYDVYDDYDNRVAWTAVPEPFEVAVVLPAAM